MKINQCFKKNSGYTLVEMMIVLAIIALISTGIVTYIKQARQVSSGNEIGSQVKEALGGLTSYQSANFDALATGAAVAGFAAPLLPTEAELKTAGFLNSTFQGASLTTGGLNYLVERLPVGCVAPACDLRATVNTNNAILDEDGLVNYSLLAAASDVMGNDASYSTDITPATISGKNGSWTQANPAGAVTGIILGHAGFGASGLSQFVRNGDTRPISLNGGFTNNGSLTNNGALTNNGNATVTGASALNGMTANNGTITALNSTNHANSGNLTSATGTITTLAATTGNITTGNITALNSNGITLNGTQTVNNGSINVNNGNVSTNDPSGYGTLMAGTGGNASIYTHNAGWTKYTQLVQGTPWGAGWNGLYTSEGLQVNGAQGAGGTVTSGQAQLNTVVTENTGCAPNGLVARDSVGLLLSCQSSVWKKASGVGGKQLTSSISGIYANSSTNAGVFFAGSTGQFTSCTSLLDGSSLTIDGSMNVFSSGVRGTFFLGNIASGTLYYASSLSDTDQLQITPTGIMDTSTCFNGGGGVSPGFFTWIS